MKGKTDCTIRKTKQNNGKTPETKVKHMNPVFLNDKI